METEPQPLTEQTEKLLDILRGFYGWTGRAAIAAKLGKVVLSSHDVIKLELLAVLGLIEIRKVKGGGRKGHAWEYRVIEPEEEDAMPPATAE